MTSETYRYYCLDAAGTLHDARSFTAVDDEDAVARVRDKHPDAKCEVWNGSRLVASISPERLKA